MTMPMPAERGPLPPRPSRPWLAPLVACLIAFAAVLLMLVPGFLISPTAAPATAPAELAALEDGNRALEAEIARLRDATTGGVCVYDGSFYPRTVEDSPGAPAPDRQLDLLPPAPQDVRPTPDALPEQPAQRDGDGAAAEPSLTMDELLKRSTVLVMNPTEDAFGWGSGFFVAPDTLVTNTHVVGDSSQVLVVNDVIHTPIVGKVVARTTLDPQKPPPQADFALVKLDAPVASALPLSFAPPQRTQQVYASGYPNFYVGDEVLAYAKATLVEGQEATPPQGVVTNGIITTVQQSDGLSYLPHTAPISGGNSGGPLVDLCGRVVGINTFIVQTSENDFVLHGDFALASGDVVGFLEANGIYPRTAEEGCTPERVATSSPRAAATPQVAEPDPDN